MRAPHARRVLRPDRHAARLSRTHAWSETLAARRSHVAVRADRRGVRARSRGDRRGDDGAARRRRQLLHQRQADRRGRRAAAVRRRARVGHRRQGRLAAQPAAVRRRAHDQGDVRAADRLPLSVPRTRRRPGLTAPGRTPWRGATHRWPRAFAHRRPHEAQADRWQRQSLAGRAGRGAGCLGCAIGGGGAQAEGASSGGARTGKIEAAEPAPAPAADGGARGARGMAPRWSLDADPEGPLRARGSGGRPRWQGRRRRGGLARRRCRRARRRPRTTARSRSTSSSAARTRSRRRAAT